MVYSRLIEHELCSLQCVLRCRPSRQSDRQRSESFIYLSIVANTLDREPSLQGSPLGVGPKRRRPDLTLNLYKDLRADVFLYELQEIDECIKYLLKE